MTSDNRNRTTAGLPCTVVAAVAILLCIVASAAFIASPAHAAVTSTAQGERIVFSERDLDLSGETRLGVASFYANRFGGRKMADGTPMRLDGNNAASMTLPLGTVARVTNLSTGMSALVTIRDRGPYVRGRIVDLSPGTARRIGLDRRTGLTTVAVEPLLLPKRAHRAQPESLDEDMRYASVR
ncbi:MAG TPA: septal ring lytic transglycosylase RlpA family protein [Steroidobacteraceae bacterium]|nr:septal ring lytic transglycosylase RlpA family protein [Steroidobacteraceae bacterium]